MPRGASHATSVQKIGQRKKLYGGCTVKFVENAVLKN